MRQSTTITHLRSSCLSATGQSSMASAPQIVSNSHRSPQPRDIIAAARATTARRGRVEDGNGSEEENDPDDGKPIPLSQMLKGARSRGESKRLLMQSVATASRAELEYMVQMNERDVLVAEDALQKEVASTAKFKQQLERSYQMLEEQRAEMERDAAEMQRLREFKHETLKAQSEKLKAGPSEDAWTQLKSEQAQLKAKEKAIEESLRARELQLASGEAELRARLDEVAERESIAEEKTAKAMEATAAAMEASAAAETRALEAAARRENGEHFAALRAVARDRLLMRAIRDEGDGAAWWELIGRTHAQAEVKNEDNSGLTMALDAEFLVAGLMGSSSGSGGDAGNAPKTHVQSRLPELLRATAEGRASEALVIRRAPRGVGWLQAFVAEICADKLVHDTAAEAIGEPIIGLAPFLKHWAASRFGMQATVSVNLWTFHQALMAHRARSVEAATILVFLELPETPRLHKLLSFYLHCRALVENDIIAVDVRPAAGDQPSSGPFAKKGSIRPSSAGGGGVRAVGGGSDDGGSFRFRNQRRVGAGSGLEEKALDFIRVELHTERSTRRVLLLSRAWEAADRLFRPAHAHLRLALMRELQAAARPFRRDVPPPLRSFTPLEQHVVDFEHFLISCAVFFDLSTHLSAVQARDQPTRQRLRKKTGGALSDHPLAAASLAVLRRSMALSSHDAEEEDDGLQHSAVDASGSSGNVLAQGVSGSVSFEGMGLAEADAADGETEA